MIPVYLINGFLESGKTEFIKYTISQPYFKTKGTTLLILCEEGELEYEETLLKQTKTAMEIIEDEEDFNIEYLMELEKKHKPERIIIEYNGMWNVKDMKLPVHWSIDQQITMIDASTFPMYYTNMKSMVAEMVRKSEMIIFNRCDGIKELSNYKRNVKAVNQQAEIIFEDSQGEITEMMEEELPYDINQPVITLNDQEFAIWYLDSLDHIERYVGKTVEFVGQVLKPKSFPSDYFVPGRLAMTCCADDIAYRGVVAKGMGNIKLQTRDWVVVEGKIVEEYSKLYRGVGPVLYVKSIERSDRPEQEVATFY